MTLFVFGLGYSALHFVHEYREAFAPICGTVRTLDKRDQIRRDGVDAFVFNQQEFDADLPASLRASDRLLVSIAPDAHGDPVLNTFGAMLADHPPARIVYLSTIGVYGDHDGAWVDETTLPSPASARSQWRLAAEEAWIAFAKQHGADLHVLRLAGIYGPGRSAIDNLRAGKARRIVKPGQIFNRIHVADIAQSIARCFTRYRQKEIAIWNVTDNEPAPPQDVVLFAAQLLGVEPPPEIAFEGADMTPMARSFYGENKRVSNRAMRESLGVTPLYPTYREGLKNLLDIESVIQPK